MRGTQTLAKSLATIAALSAFSMAHSLFISGFEGLTASAAGTPLSGQEGWYVPAVAGTIDLNAWTYAGNALTLPAHPQGSTKFIGNISQGGTALARGQRATTFSSGPNYFQYDFCARYNGTLPATDNVASFSHQPSTTVRGLIALVTWSDITTAVAVDQDFNVYDSAGVALLNQNAGPAWTALPVNNWYRNEIWYDFTTNAVTQIAITDLQTGIRTVANPTGWFLQGGSTGGTFTIPTDVRFFVGGATAGNAAGFDNFIVGTPPLAPSTATIVSGSPFGGDINSLAAGDEDKFYIINDESMPNSGVVCSGGGAAVNPAAVGFAAELSASRSDLQFFIKAKDMNTNTFVTLSVTQSTLADSYVGVFVNTNAARFVGVGGTWEMRLDGIPAEDLIAEDGWSTVIDRINFFAE